MSTSNKTNKKHMDYFTLNRPAVTFKACPEAMEFIRFDTIDLSLIAPLSKETHNGVRVKGPSDWSVNRFMDLITLGAYDPIKHAPPCVIPLPKSSSLYKEGYRYRMGDGHTRRDAHFRLGLDKMDVAVVKFKSVHGVPSDYWMYTFMLEKNTEEGSDYQQEYATSQDKIQTAKLLLAQALKGRAIPSYDELKELVAIVIRHTVMRKKKEKKAAMDIAVSMVRDMQNGNTDTLGDIVLPYTNQRIADQVKKFCKAKGVEPENVLTRKFNKNDVMGSRFDFDQFIYLVKLGMANPDFLKDMYIVGTVVDCDYASEVKDTRKRKNNMLPFFTDYILTIAQWLSVPKNRKLLESVGIFWTAQTADDPAEGSIFNINPKTGDAKTVISRG